MAFDTPKAQKTGSVPKYSESDKLMILKLFDLELQARREKIVRRLNEGLDDFEVRHEGLVNNIPRALRGVTVEEFATKYDGSIRAFMEAGALARTKDIGGTGDLEASVRKRKLTVDNGEGPSKSNKTARKASASPTKPREGDSTPKPPRNLPSRTPGGKGLPSALSRARFASSSQPIVVRAPSQSNIKPPTSTSFNPMLPPKTPAYPRAVRQSDTLLSANGSPLANPWTRSEIMLNSPPVGVPRLFFSFKARDGTVVNLDPAQSPDKNESFMGLTDSAKKEAAEGMVKVLEKWSSFKL